MLGAIQAANQQLPASQLSEGNRQLLVATSTFLQSAEELGAVAVAAPQGRPMYLPEGAQILGGPEEPATYVRFGAGGTAGQTFPAVTLPVATRKDTTAIAIAEQVPEKVEALKGGIIPFRVEVGVTRNYRETATKKSNKLLFHMGLAMLSVVVLIWLTLGLRESGVVGVAIPVTVGLTLFVFYLNGYTLNRITFFARIFSIGILVDDAIVAVENIVRHFRLPANQGRPLAQVAIAAVDVVGNPTILATGMVIVAILPIAFAGRLMGPYMRSIAVRASAAMVFSRLVAFIATPWAALRLLRQPGSHHQVRLRTGPPEFTAAPCTPS